MAAMMVNMALPIGVLVSSASWWLVNSIPSVRNSSRHDQLLHTLEKLRLSATKCNQPARSDLLKCLLVDARSIF
jgi:hypothetical protein